MQMGLFNEPKYQVHHDIMFLLKAAKVLVNEVVLPEIAHIFGNAERKPLHQQQQRQENRFQRVHILALVNMIVEPKLKKLAAWKRQYNDKMAQTDTAHLINGQYPNAKHLNLVNFNYKLYHTVNNTFRHCSAHF
jgi:dynactin complex subunit